MSWLLRIPWVVLANVEPVFLYAWVSVIDPELLQLLTGADWTAGGVGVGAGVEDGDGLGEPVYESAVC